MKATTGFHSVKYPGYWMNKWGVVFIPQKRDKMCPEIPLSADLSSTFDVQIEAGEAGFIRADQQAILNKASKMA